MEFLKGIIARNKWVRVASYEEGYVTDLCNHYPDTYTVDRLNDGSMIVALKGV